MSSEGANQSISGTATDQAGNTAQATLTGINIDKTPPTLTFGVASPAPNAAGWNNTNVSIPFTAADALSGIASTSPQSPLLLTAEGRAVTGQVTVTDVAGNAATFTSPAFKIDKTPPTITASQSPPPNVFGWNNTDVTVTFTCRDTLSGVASCPDPVVVTAEGAGQIITGIAGDVAGNHTQTFVTVNLDKTPPEAFVQFDPATLDIVVFGRDALSGIPPFPPGPLVPLSSVLTRWGQAEDRDEESDHDAGETDENGEGEAKLNAELRTYRIVDVAGNTLLLVQKVKKEDHEIKARVVSLQYNNGPVLTLPKNKSGFEWALNKDGSLTELEQEITVGQGQAKQEVEAKFEGKKDETTIKVERPEPETEVVKPGLILLRLATSKGSLVIEF